jgi:hypothetical protein
LAEPPFGCPPYVGRKTGQRRRVRIKMRTLSPLATLVNPQPWCVLWRTSYASLACVNIHVATGLIDWQFASAHAPVKRRIRPILHARCVTVLHRIDMDVVNLVLQITLVTNNLPVSKFADARDYCVA